MKTLELVNPTAFNSDSRPCRNSKSLNIKHLEIRQFRPSIEGETDGRNYRPFSHSQPYRGAFEPEHNRRLSAQIVRT